MRRQPTEMRSQGTRIRPRDESRGASAKRSRLRHLALESLEVRALMATAPTPIVSGWTAASTGSFNSTSNNDSSPLIAIDPLNSQKEVTVFTDRDTSVSPTLFEAVVTVSNDGGKTWSTAGVGAISPSVDPTSTTGALLLDHAEGVGFDRSNNFYVGILETNNNNAGAVIVDRFSFAGATPGLTNRESDNNNPVVNPLGNPVYSWNQTLTNANLQPTVLNFSMAVDSSVASYSDPTTGVVQTDPNSGAVYIAWTLNTPPPPNPPPWNPDTVQVVASADGVDWPATSLAGDSGAVTVSHGNAGGFNAGFAYSDPQITVSQGKAGGSDGGDISVVFDDFKSGSGAGVDDIDFASLTFGLKNNGLFGLTDSNANSYTTITTTRVRGALAAPYPLSTPSSPLGIGPGAVIAVDNTLGSFSADQGRIYVAFVNRANTTNNPADNTDIFLIHSDNDGATWSAPVQVNDDAGTVDGHSGAVDVNNAESDDDAQFNDGRPQYEPQVAVDPTTGTVAMSWLDVRDDPALDRYADYLTASIDGGATFSSQGLPTTEYTTAQINQGVPQPFANQPNVVADAITGKEFIAGPYSGNESGNNPNAETSLSFGITQGLAIANGIIHPVWSTTVKDGLGNFNSNNANERLSIQTALATFPAGPRVVTGTMGVVGPTTVDGVAFNNVASLDGTDELTGFVVTFDRPVSIASFTPSQVHVFYNSASLLSGTPVAVGNTITALNPTNGGLEATTFLVPLAVPQSAVGTYSYTVGPGVTDLMRTAVTTPNLVSDPAGTASEVFIGPGVPQTIHDSTLVNNPLTSTITVSGVGSGNLIQDVAVTGLTISPYNDANLTIQLMSPSGTTVTLFSGPGVTAGTAGSGFQNTGFSDHAAQQIETSGPGPGGDYGQLYVPMQSLDTAFANQVVDGPWKLIVTDLGTTGATASLVSWGLDITPQTPTTPSATPPSPALPKVIPHSTILAQPTASTLVVSNAPSADVVDGTVVVSNLTINYGGSGSPLTIQLQSPSGRTATLAANVGSLSGATLSSNAFNGDQINGTWTLIINDAAVGVSTGTLVNWSLGAPAGSRVSPTTSFGDKMDQNDDGVAGEASDLFEAPAPLSGSTLQAPFDGTTGPLLIPGPHVVSTSVPNGVVDPSGTDTTDANLVVNGTVGSISVTFDRLMSAASFTPAQVISISGPNGPISTAGITVSPSTGTARTFTISGFPLQTISGTYSVVLGSGITSAAGDAMDANENAGLDLLFNKSTPGDTTSATTYPAPGLPATIGAGQTVTSSITVNDSYVISDLQLALDIAYPNDSDLAATLTFTPAGTGVAGAPIRLFTNIGKFAGSKANFTNTVFTDALTTASGTATTQIDNGAPPYLGLFNPEQPFTPLIGGQVQGTYTLTITNSGTGTGTLSDWSLLVTKTNADTGLGEPVADRSTVGFRIFTMSPTNTQSSNTWTAVGPASQNNTADAGEVTAIAVDPSDPSGNTVYVGGASGGIWRTTDYLTNNPNGPTYVPLTQDGLYGSLNISSIAIFPRNNDPNQSVIIAGTGSTGNGQTPLGGGLTNAGVGFLITFNGGQNWTLLDSTANINADGTDVPEPLSAAKGKTARDDAFVGTSVFKVLVDPHVQPDGNLIFYAAVSGTNTHGVDEGGVWKSTDSGRDWQRMIAGNATDITFDPNSGAINAISNPTGNLSVLYAAFGTGGATASGVYISPNKGQTWTLMSGGVGDPLILEDQKVNTPVPLGTNPGAPSGSRIVLAKPVLTGSTIQGDVTTTTGNSALEDAQYETWLYAASVDGGGQFVGLYVTKDNGANWTLIKIPTASFAAGPNEVVPTNNPGSPQYNITRGLGVETVALTVDPNNPMVVYIGGTYDNGNRTAMIRVDITHLADPYSLYSSAETLGGQLLEETTSPASIFQPATREGDGFAIDPGTGVFYLEPDPLLNSFVNLLRNPSNPFQTGASFFVAETAGLSNDGSGAWWTPFDTVLDGTTNIQAIVAEKDPLTGKTRLLIGDDQGVFSGVDDGTGNLVTEVGGADGGRVLPTGSRNGNLQISQFYNGATQPGSAAATTAGGLFYGASNANGDPVSDPNILADGNLNWSAPFALDDDGTDVATDQIGTGTGFFTMHPGLDPLGPTDFFQVGRTESTAVGRTFNLIQATGTGFSGDPQWPDEPSFNFAVNPVDNQDAIIGSAAGRLFGTEDQGEIWNVLAQPADLDGSVIPALAYGAPAPGASGALDNYLLVGTAAGNIFVTFTGGGAAGNVWTKIATGLDGSPVERIVTDPTRGTHDAFAVTQKGVYYDADTAVAGSSWVNITGNLFKLTANAFGDSSLTEQQLQSLDALAVDWRYVIPNPAPKAGTATDPNAPTTHPVVYVAGQGGVFRTLDSGDGAATVWAAFPDPSVTTAPQGNMPIADVTDLDMELGNINPTIGHPDVSTGANVLLATTYGTGDYAIHLSPIVFNTTANPIKVTQAPSGTLTFTGLSEQSAFGNSVTVTIEDVTDPNNPIVLGTGKTDAFGNFSAQGNYPQAPAGNPFLFDGARKVEIFATDSSGNAGNPVTIPITNNLPAPAAPAFVNPTGAAAPLTVGVISGSTVITTSTAPAFAVTLPGTNTAASVSLVRINAQNVKTTVKTLPLTGSGTIQDPGPVAVGTYTYEVQYTVTIPGTPAPTTSPLSAGTTVKVVAPETIGLLASSDSGTQGDGITNVKQPTFVGAAVPNATNDPNLTADLVVVAAPAGSGIAAGQVLGSVGDSSTTGFYSIKSAVALPDGTYSLAIRTRDARTPFDSVTSPALTLTISTTGPANVPTINLLAASVVPPNGLGDAPGLNSTNATVARRPSIFGMTDAGVTVNIFESVNGGPVTPLISTTSLAFSSGGHAPGYYQVQLPSNLGDGTISLFAFAVNAAGNPATGDPAHGIPDHGTLSLKVFSVAGDYTGVGRAGLATYTPASGGYAFAHPGTAVTSILGSFGLANVDIPVPGDYNGDGMTDAAIYRPTNGFWAIDENSSTTGQAPAFVFVPPIVPPGPNVIPAPGDFDADGMTDPAVYSITATGFGVFTILHNQVVPGTVSATQSVAWGLAGDTPVSADFDGAGSAQVAVYRPSTGAWYVRSSGAGGGAATPAGKQEPALFVTAFQPGDVPVPADYDGVGRIEPAIYRPGTETFFIFNPITKTTRTVVMPNLQQNAGQLVMPASADFTGDGKADPAIFDQATATWEYIDSTSGKVFTQQFGLSFGDIALTAPEQYRALANASAQSAFRTAGAIAFAPAGATGTAAAAAVSATSPAGKAAPAAVVVGATTPTGLTSTGKASTLPAVPAPTAKPVLLVDSGTGSARPAQAATDSAIASLGKGYNGLFV